MDRAALEEFAAGLAAQLKLPGGFSLVLLSDAAMQRYHQRFKGEKKTTDVLSFPAGGDVEGDGERYLGDILISAEAADRQKKGDLHDELRVLCLHGVLHLMGYDHETDEGEMDALEANLRGRFRLP